MRVGSICFGAAAFKLRLFHERAILQHTVRQRYDITALAPLLPWAANWLLSSRAWKPSHHVTPILPLPKLRRQNVAHGAHWTRKLDSPVASQSLWT